MNDLAIGVKPKVFSIEYQSASGQRVVFKPRLSRSNRMIFEANVYTTPGRFSLIFTVGRGHNPNSTRADEDFVFYVPEFDVASKMFGYDFVQRKTKPKEIAPLM